MHLLELDTAVIVFDKIAFADIRRQLTLGTTSQVYEVRVHTIDGTTHLYKQYASLDLAKKGIKELFDGVFEEKVNPTEIQDIKKELKEQEDIPIKFEEVEPQVEVEEEKVEVKPKRRRKAKAEE